MSPANRTYEMNVPNLVNLGTEVPLTPISSMHAYSFEVKPYSVYSHSINRVESSQLFHQGQYSENETPDKMQSFLAHMDGRQFGVLWSENNFKILKTFSPFDRARHGIRKTMWLSNARIIKLKNWFLVKLFQDMIPKVVILMKLQGRMHFNSQIKLLTSLALSSHWEFSM